MKANIDIKLLKFKKTLSWNALIKKITWNDLIDNQPKVETKGYVLLDNNGFLIEYINQ